MLGEERPEAIPKDDEKFWPLAKLRAQLSGRSVSEEILDQINDWWLARELEEARTSPDLLVGARALVAARRCFQVLCANGFKQLAPHLYEMKLGVDEIRRLFLKEIVRRLLVDKIDEEKAGEVMRELSGLIEAGQWDDWRQTFDEVEEEVCAKLAAKTAAAST